MKINDKECFYCKKQFEKNEEKYPCPAGNDVYLCVSCYMQECDAMWEE